MSARESTHKKMPQKQPERIIPTVLVILVAVGLLGLVVKVSLSQANKTTSSSIVIPSDDITDRWDYIMTDLVGQTRHFKGSPDAPVTILEFSDFQ